MKVLYKFTYLLLFTGLALSSCSSEGADTSDDASSASDNEESEVDEIVYDECIGDYVVMQEDVIKLIIKPFKNESIILGKTTRTEMEELTGNADGFERDYNGLNLTAFYSYENEVLQSIALDCFYHCDAALEMIAVDQSIMNNSLTSALNIEGVEAENNIIWEWNETTVRLANFEDGYGIYLDAKL